MTATAPVVMTIIGINVVVFILQNVIAGFTDRFAMSPAAIADGEYWRLITPVFLHSEGFIFHIIMNCYILYALGPNVEQSFGSVRFAVMYLVAGFMGNVLSFVMPPDVGSLGASGAVFGIAGVLLVYLFRRRRSAFVAQYLRSILFFIGINLAFGLLFRGGIDNWAHIGGLLGGIVLGLGFDREDQLKPVTQVVSVLVVLGVGAFLVMTQL
jgi:rhomboid protease GluP